MDNITLLICFVVVILIFLFGRELICWYLKIQHRLDLLKEISEKLTIIINQSKPK
jgi:hypothetical protein